MLVTCYYDIYGKPERFVEYVSLFYDLGISGLPITLFTDPSLVYKFRIFPPTVTVIGMPLIEFELYQMGMAYDRDLPVYRTPEKDTKAFFSLMNTKIEFVKKAAERWPEIDTFCWIDFGILKIVKQSDRFLQKLAEIDRMTVPSMIIPGCWSIGQAFSVEQIHWRFCGGFFVISRHFIDRFYDHSRGVLRDFCTMEMYKLTWETNVWSTIEFCAERENIQWYFADHDDTIVLNIDYALNATLVSASLPSATLPNATLPSASLSSATLPSATLVSEHPITNTVLES